MFHIIKTSAVKIDPLRAQDALLEIDPLRAQDALLEKFWRISLYVTDAAIAKLYSM